MEWSGPTHLMVVGVDLSDTETKYPTKAIPADCESEALDSEVSETIVSRKKLSIKEKHKFCIFMEDKNQEHILLTYGLPGYSWVAGRGRL